MATRFVPANRWLLLAPRVAAVVTNGEFPSDVSGWSQQGAFPTGTAWVLQATYGPTIPSLSPDLDAPAQVAKDSGGNIYVVNTGTQRIVKLSAAGAFVAQTAALVTPTSAVCVDPSDRVYVSENTDVVIRRDSALVFQNSADWGTSLGSAVTIKHLAADASNVYATDSTGNRIVKGPITALTPASAVVGSLGSGNGQFGAGGPWGIAHNSTDSLLYVVDSGNNRMQVFTTAGVYQRQWPIGTGARGCAVDASGNILVAEFGGDVIKQYNKTTGALIDSFPQTDPEGIVVASGDVVWVSNVTGDNIAKWDEAATSASGPTWNNTMQVGEALGALALTITNGDVGDTAYVVNSKYFPIHGRETIDVSATVRTTIATVTPRLVIFFYDALGGLVATEVEADWTPTANVRARRAFSAPVPSNATQYRVGFAATAGAEGVTGTVYLDDVATGKSELIVAEPERGTLRVEAQVPARWL